MTTDRQEKMRRAFDLLKVKDVYIKKGVVDNEAFQALFQDMSDIRNLDIPGLDWVLFDHMLSVRRDVPFEMHIEALNAGLNRPYAGIEDFLRTLIETGLEPPAILNRTAFYKIPDSGRYIGETLLELGLLSHVELERSLGIRVMIAQATGQRVAVGQIIRSLTNLSMVDLIQALGIQAGIRFEGIDASAPQIFAATVPEPD